MDEDLRVHLKLLIKKLEDAMNMPKSLKPGESYNDLSGKVHRGGGEFINDLSEKRQRFYGSNYSNQCETSMKYSSITKGPHVITISCSCGYCRTVEGYLPK